MNPGMYFQFAEIEDKHWWFISRKYLIENILKKLDISHFKNILDLGCGVGGNMRFLSNYCEKISGLDCSEIAIKLAKEKWPDFNFIVGNANQLTALYPKNTFNLVTLFNVMYHQWILNDKDLLCQIHDVLQPGGYLLLTEPAFMHLWRRHDEQDMGKHRYQMSEMKKLLSESGYKVVFKTYFNIVSYLPALLLAMHYKLRINRKIDDAKNGVSEIELPNDFLNNLLISLMKMETYFIKSLGSIPIGVSLLCLAQKK